MNRAGLVVVAGVAVAIALLIVSGLDRTVHDLVLERRRGLADVAGVVTVLGSSTIVLPVSLVLAALFWRHGVRSEAFVLLAGPAIAALLALIIKMLVGRDRPPTDHHLVDVGTPSFPSGHATHAAAFWTAMVAVLWAANGRQQTLMVIVGVSVATLVGTTRLILGVHWLSDVVAGWALGAATVAILSRAISPRRTSLLVGCRRLCASDSFDERR